MGAPRVLHIVGDSKFGGGARIILALAVAAKSDGFIVDVLTTDKVFERVLRRARIGVVPLPAIWREIRPVRDLIGLVTLAKYLRTEKYEIVHTHTSKAGFVGRLAAWIAGAPVIVHTVHGFAFHERSGKIAMEVYSGLERLAAHWCHRIVTVSRFHRDWALRLGIGSEETVLAIPNGIEEVSVPSGTRERYREVLGVVGDETVILCSGRLAPQKGLEDLVDAVAILEKTSPWPFRVVLAGDGPLRSVLEAQSASRGVANQIQFLGFRDDVSALITASDIIVLPSLREGLSIPLLEAMAAGKPIVTTMLGSNSEVCEATNCAELVPPNDPRALAAGIARIRQTPAWAEELGRRARRTFQEHYTISRMLSDYRRLYSQLLPLMNR